MVKPTDYTLGALADSEAEHYRIPIDIAGAEPARLLAQLEKMLEIRLVEEWIGDEVISGKIKCPCHLAIGQEAIPVGISARLRATDRVFGTHRSHGHFLAQGGTLDGLLAETLGKITGCSKGMGGSMHLYSGDTGFMGSVPIVSATVSLATGAALAAKLDKKGGVAVAYFGDGAMEEGSVHESLNFASIYSLPMIFVVENNLFSSHLHIDQRQPQRSVARFGEANSMATRVVDGNDVHAVEKRAGELIALAREGKGPGFLEAVTYRWRGHVGPREDEDVGVMRKHDLIAWKKRDPIGRLATSLKNSGALTDAAFETMRARTRQAISDAWDRAVAADYPPAHSTLTSVYADGVARGTR